MPETISTKGCNIHFNEEGFVQLNAYIQNTQPSGIFVLVDENTHEYCLPFFLSQIVTEITIEIIEIESGEENKNIHTCTGVWEALSELGANRKSLMINLGGGVITDLGGFVAATFMRGMAFINVPTTLLAMVDASVGGKTGIDLGMLKNQVGVIQLPAMVLINTLLLESLPARQIRSGFTEMLKHGLIYDREHWEKLKGIDLTNHAIPVELIHESITIKNKVVTLDPYEKGLRKILNFGHTLGHAIESYLLQNENRETLLHGEAIAIGIILESFLSSKTTNLSEQETKEIKDVFLSWFDKIVFTEKEIAEIIEFMKYDKKNAYGRINFVMLEKTGKAQIDHQASHSLIQQAFQFYLT
ncbi:3-dehydroquinate synthase [Ascidiimonas aurantiaca]|uniref:3-dehydroquinate synthase n=1 Tax=Ascidiimonas aurantiaca TaxID=1685432 RepID=UPI0030EEEA05